MANIVDEIYPININIIDIENFLSESWEKSNPGGFLTIEENRITATDLPRGLPTPGAWVKKDFGTDGIIGDFKHQLTVHIESMSQEGALFDFWKVTAQPDLNTHMEHSDIGDGLCVYSFWAIGYEPVLYLRDFISGTYKSYIIPFSSFPITLYLDIYREGTVCNMDIYSDFERTNFLVHQHLDCPDINYRFVFAAANRHIGVPGAPTITAYVEDMWLVD